VSWNIPLLEGYEHEFVDNVAARPGPEHFDGIRNPTLTSTVAAFGPDVVLVYGWNLQSHLALMRQLKGRVAVLFRGDSTLLDRQPFVRRMARRAVLHWVYRHVDGAVAVGRANADYFRWVGVPGSRIWLAPHSVDNAFFANAGPEADSQAARWRDELGIAVDHRVVLFAGKLQAKKDPLLLLDAFPRNIPDAHLVFVGSGELEPELRARAADRQRVHFLPFQNQAAMPAVYRLGDLFVIPSRGPGETWGLALNEAMACGVPVIASDRVGATADLVIEGVTGWRFAAGNAGGLASALRDALTLPPAILGQRGAAASAHIAGWSTARAVQGIAAATSECLSLYVGHG
jgi:glycosyltransferase involved in cell wall biosynthesis